MDKLMLDKLSLIYMKNGTLVIAMVAECEDSSKIRLVTPYEITNQMNMMTGETMSILIDMIPSGFYEGDHIDVPRDSINLELTPSRRLVEYYAKNFMMGLMAKAKAEQLRQQAIAAANKDEEEDYPLPELPAANTINDMLTNLKVKPTIH